MSSVVSPTLLVLVESVLESTEPPTRSPTPMLSVFGGGGETTTAGAASASGAGPARPRAGERAKRANTSRAAFAAVVIPSSWKWPFRPLLRRGSLLVARDEGAPGLRADGLVRLPDHVELT